MLIGLTGMYCAGKNYVAGLLEQRGFAVLDVDKLGHIAIENKKEAIFSRFGDGIKSPDGTVNRRLLGEKVFGKGAARSAEMSALEDIVHPEVNRLTLDWIALQGAAIPSAALPAAAAQTAPNGKNCVINAAVLHKSAVFAELECIIVVNAPWFVRLMRAKKRDKLSFSALFKRFSSQKQFITQYLAGNADIYRVENSGFAGKRLERQIDAILSGLKTSVP